MQRTISERLDYGLGRTVAVIDSAEEVVAAALLAAVVIINGMEIFTRTLLNDSLFWVYEVNLLLGNWIYFIGICLVYYRQRDITVDFLFNKLGGTIQRIYLIVLNLVIIIVLAVIVFYGWRLLIVQSRTTTLGLKIPNYLFSLPVVIGSLSIILILIKQSFAIYLSAAGASESRQ